MTTSIIDLHLSSTQYADTRTYKLGHCQMVAWLIENFRKIKSGEITYQDYEKEGSSNGISTFKEESFELFKSQDYV